MEVHHHSHTSRKKWTHYLWEFLMLFLAVFCGFDVWYFNEIMDLTVGAEKVDSFKKKTFPLLSNKKEDFLQYANLCQVRSFDLKRVLIKIEIVAERAERLLILLKKEYHLK